MPTITVIVSKVDIMQWWILQEIQARDEVEMKKRNEEKQRKALRQTIVEGEVDGVESVAAGSYENDDLQDDCVIS